MKSLPLLSLSLMATLGVGCSNPAQESAPAPTQQAQIKKRTQALGAVSLREVPVSPAVLTAAGEDARVRSFEIDAEEGSYTVEEVAQVALQQGVTDPVTLPWQVGVERDREETRTSLRYLNGVVPAIEAELGAEVEYRTGYYHWFRPITEESCHFGDALFLTFPGVAGEEPSGVARPGKVFVIETEGTTEC